MSADDPKGDPPRHRHGSLISTRPLPLRGGGDRAWSPLRHPVLAWRYGWTHPDEDLLGVTGQGRALRRGTDSRYLLHGREENNTIHDEVGMRHYYAEWSRRMGRPAYDPYREGKPEPVRAAA